MHMSDSAVVVIGVFDGVHKGHQVLLNRAKEISDGRPIIALTFDPHPTTVFAPDKAPTMLTTLADRVELLKIHNADRKSTRLNSSHVSESRMPSSA